MTAAKANKYLYRLVLSAFIMTALPWLTVTFIRSDAGMAVCFLLFFAVNPAWSIILGVLAGENLQKQWSLPVLSAAFFLAGTWLFFDMGETAFLLYAGIYLVLGTGCMLISSAVRKKDR